VIKAKRMNWVGHVAHMGEMRNVSNVSVQKPEGRRLLGRQWHRWKDNIRIGLRQIRWEGVD
jgi:hypothetical protein